MTLGRRQLLQIAAVFAPGKVALAQSYPNRMVRIVVPYAPGGPSDILARLAGQKLSDELGQKFLVENVPGASGNIGMGRIARSAPDGYSLAVVPPNVVVNPMMYASVPYDPYKDFDPVTIAVSSPIVLAVNASMPVRSVEELASMVRANPSRHFFASPGIGTPPHLVGEHFRLELGLDLPHVPFTGAGAAVNSAIGGHTPIVFSSLPPVVPQIKEGRLRALAVMSKSRAPVLANVPTIVELGHPDLTGEGWFAFLAPAGTPREILRLLHQQIVKAMALADVKERLSALGYETVGNSPEACAEQFKSEGAKWARVMQKAGIKAE
ncbi:Bug family tripartite tricarboxylate transporter substrate binding protein [Reyranella sp.]|uniref:Bug family tripartite tricarboxylate transporter substrate binding protein n=1 Tax=Reyranella sp. TaxID=1929291 RepID=UPI003783F840